MSIENQKVVVIGGSSGIGLATAQAVAAVGAQVLIASRSAEKLEQAKQQMVGTVETKVLDLSQEESIQQFFADVGSFDHLVVTASSAQTGAFREQTTVAARQTMDSKFWSPYLAAKYAQINPQGSIVLFSGVLSRRPAPGYAALAAANAAIEALGRALALELAPIRVNVVSPGLVDTPAYAGMPEANREAFFQSTASKLPVQRIGVPADIAAAVLYLLDNRYTTGVVLDIDGGSLLVG